MISFLKEADINIYGFAYFCKFLDYFKTKNILYKHFKLKDFVNGEYYNCYGGRRRFCDIDLTPGKVRYALTFGLQKGYIEKLSGTYRMFNLVKLRSDGFI